MSTIPSSARAKDVTPRLSTTEQLEAVFAELVRAGDHHAFCAGVLTVEGGMLFDKVVQLRWADIDFHKGTIATPYYGNDWKRVIMPDRVRRELSGGCPSAAPDDFVLLPHQSRGSAKSRLASSVAKAGKRLGFKVGFPQLWAMRWKAEAVRLGPSV